MILATRRRISGTMTRSRKPWMRREFRSCALYSRRPCLAFQTFKIACSMSCTRSRKFSQASMYVCNVCVCVYVMYSQAKRMRIAIL
jgi:hypothetical protein